MGNEADDDNEADGADDEEQDEEQDDDEADTDDADDDKDENAMSESVKKASAGSQPLSDLYKKVNELKQIAEKDGASDEAHRALDQAQEEFDKAFATETKA